MRRQIEIRSLRELTDFPFVFQVLVATGLHSYQAVLRAYRPEEAINFSRKYVDTWQQAFMEHLTIAYEYHPVTIG